VRWTAESASGYVDAIYGGGHGRMTFTFQGGAAARESTGRGKGKRKKKGAVRWRLTGGSLGSATRAVLWPTGYMGRRVMGRRAERGGASRTEEGQGGFQRTWLAWDRPKMGLGFFLLSKTF
jgi:hypothetical protein